MPETENEASNEDPVEQPKLHLDEDTSDRRLFRALNERGHDVTRTPNDWIHKSASDELQLMSATVQGRILFTFNVGDFQKIVAKQNTHAGLVLAQRRHWTLSTLIAALDKMLTETTAEDWPNQVRWLNQWKE